MIKQLHIVLCNKFSCAYKITFQCLIHFTAVKGKLCFSPRYKLKEISYNI